MRSSVRFWYVSISTVCFVFFFFFQAEDGIRDLTVTGVQTCALPIYLDGAGFADDFRRSVAVLELERGLVFGEILVGLQAAGFQQRDLQAGFREALAGPASGSTGADDDDIIRMVLLLRHKMKIRSEC